MRDRAQPRVIALFELLAFTSLEVAAAAAALCAAASRALGVEPNGAALWLCAAGTLAVYNVDRLRDVERDRATAPLRTAFVERWRGALVALASSAGLLGAALVWRLGARTLLVLAPAAGLGLLHRRLKRFAWWKPLYVSAAWAAVVVGVPAVQAAEPRGLAFVIAIVAASVLANVIACNLRDEEAPSLRFGARVPLRLARAITVAAAVLALAAPDAIRPLAAIPLATFAALAAFRPGELYGHVAIDGALIAGALVAVAWP